MSSITHDTRPPMVVVVGKFNPAIFSLHWTAFELFGVGEGEQVEVTETTIELPNGIQMGLTFLEGVGLNFGDDKIQISLLDFSDATVDRATSVISNMFEKLPHTPVGAIGINFRWFDEEPSQDLLDMFDTAEGLEAGADIIERNHKIKIAANGFTLNFSRQLIDGNVFFDFNYHRAISNTREGLEIVGDDFIKKEWRHSKEFLSKWYGYDNFEKLAFKDGAEEVAGGEHGKVDEIEEG